MAKQTWRWFHCYCYTQGYFCDGTLRNAAPQVLSQKDASRYCVPEPIFFRKIALVPPDKICRFSVKITKIHKGKSIKMSRHTSSEKLHYATDPREPKILWAVNIVIRPVLETGQYMLVHHTGTSVCSWISYRNVSSLYLFPFLRRNIPVSLLRIIPVLTIFHFKY
jgi:hypothetical protein